MEQEKKNLGDILIVGGVTVGSRVTGLVRDVLIYSMLGASRECSAFIFAFTLPNLFRRLLGEGALTSALIPVLSGELEKKGDTAFFGLMGKVFSRVLVLLFFLALLGCGVLLALNTFLQMEPRWHLGFRYGAILFPYLFFICLSAVCGGALNSLGRFGTVALTPVMLNLSMIFALGILGFFFGETLGEKVMWLCCGVLLGGVLQLALPARALARHGWRPTLDFNDSPELRRIWGLFVPGLIGASVLQFNLLVSRGLAFSIDDTAVSVLFLASRLVELPLGIFSMAVITVVFPQVARQSARGDEQGFRETFSSGLRLILMLTVPAATGLVILAEPILNLLFGWGLFDAADVERTVPVLCISALGLPFYSLVSLYTRGFHARQDMGTPLKASCQGVVLNLVLSVVLMFNFGIKGLAAAGVVSSVWHCIYLRLMFRKEMPKILNTLAKILVASAAMGFLCFLLWGWIQVQLGDGKLGSLLTVAGVIPLGVFAYLVMLWMLKLEDLKGLLRLLQRKSL